MAVPRDELGLWAALSTVDAHGLYAKAGFVPFTQPERLMILAGSEQPARIPVRASFR